MTHKSRAEHSGQVVHIHLSIHTLGDLLQMDHQAGQSVSVGLWQLTDGLEQHGETVAIILDFGCFHEDFVEVEGEQWLWEVSKEVFEDTCDDINVFHFVKRRQSLSSNQLLLQLFHMALLAGDSVEANLV